MISYLPLILICHTSIATTNCNEDLAINKVEADLQNSPISCIMEGQSKAASLAFIPREGEPYYVKVKCVRKE